MEIIVDSEVLQFFFEILEELYRQTEDPITRGFSESMLEVCAEKPFTEIYDLIPFPHLLHKATVLMDSIIRFHPFADGNKRVALIATYFFLYWNGYDMIIPEDADKFTIAVADNKKSLNDVLSWISQHSIMTFGSVLRQKICYIASTFVDNAPALEDLVSRITTPFFWTLYPLSYFGYTIAKKKQRKPFSGTSYTNE